MVRIMFKKLAESARKPEHNHQGDAGYDLFVSREVNIPPGEWADVHTDIAIALPDTLWGEITGRSSTFRKRGMQVQHGVIDAGYRGELFIAVWNPSTEYKTIQVGERIAQLIPHERVELQWRETDELPDSQRGTGGFGSTGR
jgi:dUTP pyrophosphatase